MKVFEISPDFTFQSFYTSDPNIQEFSEISYSRELVKCEPMLPTWKPLRVFEESPKLKRGNFARSWGGGFVIDYLACQALRPIIEQSCELLPLLPHRGEMIYVMHLLECVDCLDEEKTKWATHTRVKMSQIEEYHFDPSRIGGSTLFKLPKRVTPLTVTGLAEAQYEFKSIIEREGLTGLKFEELWSDSK